MRFSVIGAGNTGQTMAAHLTIMGHDVKLYDRDTKKVEIIAANGIELRGALVGKATVKATTDISECIEGTDFIMVMTTAQGHSDVCRQMQPFLEDGQNIVIFNGNWGAIEFKRILSETLLNKNIVISETGAMIYLSDLLETGIVDVIKLKSSISLACIPARRCGEVIERLRDVYPQFVEADNVLETSLNNSNPIFHAPITLFNAARMDFAQDFRFYGDGASPLLVKYIDSIDKERIEIAQTLGIKSKSVLEIINSFWVDKYDNLYDAIHFNESYESAKAPCSFEHRYITEDIPFGIVPLAKLARMLKLKTPYIDSIITTTSLLLDRDFMSEGPDLDKFHLDEFV